jgi:hypothetical protein
VDLTNIPPGAVRHVIDSRGMSAEDEQKVRVLVGLIGRVIADFAYGDENVPPEETRERLKLVPHALSLCLEAHGTGLRKVERG